MPKVILICGKICCGKSTYAEKIRIENNAVLLSVDEIMLAVFGQYAGEKHDEYCENLQKYFFNKSPEIVQTGTDVILDWGFWQKDERDYAKGFFRSRGIPCELHYIDISDEVWRQRIEKRNALVEAGKTSAYYIDENLAKKFAEGFELLTEDEIDVRIK